jgi:hypothetical protein
MVSLNTIHRKSLQKPEVYMFLLQVGKQVLDASPRLLTRRTDLVCWEDKAVRTSIAELDGVRVLDLTTK